MLAYCGLDCYECPAYKGTINADTSLLEETAGKWGVKGGIKEVLCLGCKGDEKVLATFCSSCVIRRCAREKGNSSCALCDEYASCAKIHKFIDQMAPSVKARMDLLNSKLA